MITNLNRKFLKNHPKIRQNYRQGTGRFANQGGSQPPGTAPVNNGGNAPPGTAPLNPNDPTAQNPEVETQPTGTSQPTQDPNANPLQFRSTQDFQGANPTFRPTNSFMPQSAADVQASPGFEWRKQQAQDALNKRLAAQGMTGSGKAVTDDIGLVNQLTDQEFNRLTQQGQFDATRYDQDRAARDAMAIGNANRFDQIQTGNLNQGNLQQQFQWNSVMDLLNRQDAQNPFGQVMGAVQGLGDAYINRGKSTAPYTQNMYMPYIPSGGGGSPYVPLPTYVPPMPNGPDTTAADLINLMGY